MCVVSRAIDLSRAASIVRRLGGSLRATDAMGRADRARRGDESRRLTCLPRRPGEAASPSRLLSSGLPGFRARAVAFLPVRAASSGLLAFAAQAVAQTNVTLTSNNKLASDGVGASSKIDNARAFKAVGHSHRYKLSSVDADMQDRVGTPVDTASSHSNAFNSRPGGIIPGTLTNPLTVFRKNDGFPGAVARWSTGDRSHWCTYETTGSSSQLSPLRAAHVRPRRNPDGARQRRSGEALRAVRGHHQLVVARSPKLNPRLFGITFVLNPKRRGKNAARVGQRYSAANP